MKKSLLPLLASLAAGLVCAAAEPGGESVITGPGDEAAGLGLTLSGEVSFRDPDHPENTGRVTWSETVLSAPATYGAYNGLEWAGGALASWTRLSFGNLDGLNDEDLYGGALWLALQRPARSAWGWNALIMPGFYSDLRSGRTGEGKMLLHGALEYAWRPALRFHLGAAYDTAFGDPALYPVGGLIWQPAPATALRLVLPTPAAIWMPGARLRLFALAQPVGDRWTVEDHDAGSQVFLIEAWRAGLGGEWHLGHGLWLRLAAGLEFNRHYEVRSGDQVLLDEEVDDTWYLSTALVLY